MTNKNSFPGVFPDGLIRQHKELDHIEAQAKAAGVYPTFKVLLRAEGYRARNHPGHHASLKQLLQIALATHEEIPNDRPG